MSNISPVRVLRGHTNKVRAAAWSPNGRYVITGSADRTARIWDIATGKTINVLTEHLGRVSVVAWHPQEQRVLTGGADGLIRIWEVPSGQLLQVIEGRVGWIRGANWSPNGQFIAVGGSNGVAYIWDIKTNKFMQALEGHIGSISSVTWSPDSQYLLTSSDDTTVRISVVDIHLITAEITRRVCNLLDEEMIRKEIPDWRGREIELDDVKEYLDKYDALNFSHSHHPNESLLSLSFGESRSDVL